jgi:glycosyltransferase involved in cell wall biosynthesis
MQLNLVGKAANLAWGCEPMIQRGFEALGHRVTFADLQDAALKMLPAADLTIVLQGYGLSMVAIQTLRDRTRAPVVLWHAEVLSPTWPTMDPVVLAKADQLSRNARAYDLVVHNCSCCLSTVEALGATRVAWCSSSGVDATVHRRLPVTNEIDIGIYGWASERRWDLVSATLACLPAGCTVAWPDAAEGQCYGEALIKFINRCKLILNVHFSDTLNTETRVYESLGCGTPVVSEPISMPELFPEGVNWGKGIFYGQTPEELAHKIQFVLESYRGIGDGIEGLGLTSTYRWIHEEYSYQARCAQFLDTVEKERG